MNDIPVQNLLQSEVIGAQLPTKLQIHQELRLHLNV